MKIPTTLKHKPVIVCENYENVDAKNAYDSDAKGISLGLAQWNDRGNVDVSAKVWRYTGQKWSRQSEELPLNRVLDLTILLLNAKKYLAEEYTRKDQPSQRDPLIERVGMQGDAMSVSLCKENEKLNDDLRLFETAMAKDDELISERLHIIGKLLKEMGYIY